jgi:CRP/FNR family transcriptional regulator, cyclic AMP receptor protein
MCAVDETELRAIPLFDGLSDADLARVAAYVELIEVPTGWYLLNLGSVPEGFFVVLEGQVEVDREGETLATLGPGDFFGEIALLEDDRRTATVTTTTHVRAIVMDKPSFFEMCAEVPLVGQRINAAALDRGAR